MSTRRKEVTNADPLALLREYIINNKPIKAKDDYLSFGGTKISVLTKTAWQPAQSKKIYDLGSLWLFLDSTQNPAKYPENKYYEEMKRLNLQLINAFDKEEIINYFTGKKDYSEAINSEFNYTIVPLKGSEKPKKPKEKERHKDDRKEEIEGANATKKVKTATSTEVNAVGGGDQMEEEKEHANQKEREYFRIADLALKLEKPIDYKNKSLRRLEKSFKFSLDYFATEKTSANKDKDELAPVKVQLCKLDEILKSQTGIAESRPIIIVPNTSVQGGINLSNVKMFLEEGKYQDNSQNFSGFERSKVSIQRTIRGKTITFDVFDNVSDIKLNNTWSKIVALFVSGVHHQFSDWPDGSKPSILFSKVRGFYTKFKDMPLPDNIKKWNVKTLDIDRTRRHLDLSLKNHFWEELENFILR